MRKLNLLLPLACLAALAGCATRGGPVPYDVPNFAAPDSDRPALGSDGVIGKLDTISLWVYQLPELTRDIQVDLGGNIVLPLVGSIRAEGLTSSELAQEIETRLAAGYVRVPSVQVGVKQAAPKSVTVEGSVQRPGMFQVSGPITLLRAIALASGPNDSANIHRVVVFRQLNGQRNAAAFDLATIRTGQSPDPVIYGNDVIVVDGSKMTRVYRDILQAVPLLYGINNF